MPPRQRGGRKAGPAGTHAVTTASPPGDDSDGSGGRNDDSVAQDFEAFVRSTLSKLVEGQQLLETKLGASIEFNSERITDLEKAKADLEKSFNTLKVEVSSMKVQLARQSTEINRQERFSRRNNFRVVSIARTQGENCLEKVADILITRFRWGDGPKIERAHRDGNDKNSKPAHILVKMLSFQDKVKVLRERRQALEGLSFYIVDDLTAPDWQEKIRWKKEVKALYDRGIKLRFFAGRWRADNGVIYDF